MKLSKLKEEVRKIMYIEDTGIIDIVVASIVANSLARTTPVWLTLVGNSSAGKSQFIRPIADANPDFIHRLDTPTPNAFLSGAGGKDNEHSFLKNSIGEKGIILFSDLTVLFSINGEARNEILGIMRMIYDGEYTKKTGTKNIEWKGYAGVLSASTPSIYSYFSEVADMGERFIYYRMKPVDQHKLQEFIVNNTRTQPQMDKALTELYGEYMIDVMGQDNEKIQIAETTKNRLYHIAQFGARLRTPVHVDYRGNVDRIPQMESPARVYKQLETLAYALTCMQYHENKSMELSEEQLQSLEWCAYSLGNEERRTILKAVIEAPNFSVTVRDISAYIGFDEDVTTRYLTELTTIGLLKFHSQASSGDTAHKWSLADTEIIDTVNRLDNYTEAKGVPEEEEDEFDDEEIANIKF